MLDLRKLRGKLLRDAFEGTDAWKSRSALLLEKLLLVRRRLQIVVLIVSLVRALENVVRSKRVDGRKVRADRRIRLPRSLRV